MYPPVAFVGVELCFVFCDLGDRLRCYLVESVFSAAKDSAGIAVAGKRGLFVGGLPLC